MSTPRRRRKDLQTSNHVVRIFPSGATATGDLRNAARNLVSEPAHDEIARRAYQLFEERGGEHGADWNDWFQAERELRQRAESQVIERSLEGKGPYAAA